MIRLTAFAASAALLLAIVTTGNVLQSEAKTPDPAIDLCAHAEAENAVRGACTPNSPDGAPLTPTETVLVGGCAGGDLHIVRYSGTDGDAVVAMWCGMGP